MNRYLIIYACLASFLIACSGESSSSPISGNSQFQNSDYTGGTITDFRDGQVYKVVTIGSQTWMAQNLNYETAISYCYNDDASNCAKYGRLYSWTAAMTVCPSGWHLPSNAEWETLFNAVGNKLTAGKVLKSISGWDRWGPGTDAFGFSAIPAGIRDSYGNFSGEGKNADFWSSTEYDSYMVLIDGYDGAELHNYLMYGEFSVRCLKN